MSEIMINGFKCERCGHERAPRNKKERPRVCPSCKSRRTASAEAVQTVQHKERFHEKFRIIEPFVPFMETTESHVHAAIHADVEK
jgi:DNA-directed RNA polymerase subunit RPC12/RpoP